MRAAAVLFFGVLLSVAAHTSFRLSRADWLFHQNTRQSVSQAAALDPANWRYPSWLADLLESEGNDPAPARASALQLNPRDAALWIRRGLVAESAGHLDDAEQSLLQAATLDRLMEPRWTLMNFYFRTHQEAKFWLWARQAFAMSYNDRTPLFDLCWSTRQDPAAIAALFPGNHPVQLQFLSFLLAHDQPEAAATLAQSLLPQANPQNRPVFLTCVQRLIETGHAQQALALWKGLGGSSTNEFDHYPTGEGFDWRLPPNAGIRATISRPSAELRLSLNGAQNEACDLLSKTVPLNPARSYQLRFSYKTTGIAPASGLRVRISDQATPDLSSDDWREVRLPFRAPSELAVILLEYRRPPGMMRADGQIALRNFTVEPAP